MALEACDIQHRIFYAVLAPPGPSRGGGKRGEEKDRESGESVMRWKRRGILHRLIGG